MKKYSEIIRQCSLFDSIGDDDLYRMLTCLGAETVSFDKKYTVFREGSPARQIGIVLSGSVQTVRVDYFGNRSIISESKAGEVFGEAFACAEATSTPVTVVANEPAVTMLIDCSHILHTCKNNCAFHQQLIYNLMKILATKTILYHERIEITSARTTREKLLTYLALTAKKAGSNSFDIPFDRQELADYLEVDRSGLSAEISKLRREGVIECKKHHFEFL